MKKYRILYDKLFNAIPSIDVNGKTVTSVSLLFEYRVYDKTGNELFFSCEDSEEMHEQYLDGYYLDDYYMCSYDKDKGFKMEPTDIVSKSKYRVEYSLDSCYIDVEKSVGYSEPEQVDKDLFIKLLKNNSASFDNTDNLAAQNTTAAFEEIEK